MRKTQTSVACCQTETQSPTWSWILFVLELQRYKATSWSGQSINTDKKLRNVCLLCSRNRIWCYHVCSKTPTGCVCLILGAYTHTSSAFPSLAVLRGSHIKLQLTGWRITFSIDIMLPVPYVSQELQAGSSRSSAVPGHLSNAGEEDT